MREIIKIRDPALRNFLMPAFESLDKIDGILHRSQPGRRTIAFDLNKKAYFAKIHTGVGWKEIIKNILQYRKPIISAETEWKALLALQKLNIKAPTPLAFGKKGINPARLKSFIITKALPPSINLEDFFKAQPNVPFDQKKQIIESVAAIAKKLHQNGMNHRDFYLCHLLLDKVQNDHLNPILYLIDLHRAHIRQKTPFRWQIKDIAGLYFSSMDFNFTQQDYFRFIKTYTGKPLRTAIKQNRIFWLLVDRKANHLYQKHHRR